MVEVDEADFTPLRFGQGGEALQAVRDGRMGKARHVASRNLALGKEGSVQVSDIYLGSPLLDPAAPSVQVLPAVNIGKIEDRFVGAGNLETHYLTVFLTMRYQQRSNDQTRIEPDLLAVA